MDDLQIYSLIAILTAVTIYFYKNIQQLIIDKIIIKQLDNQIKNIKLDIDLDS